MPYKEGFTGKSHINQEHKLQSLIDGALGKGTLDKTILEERILTVLNKAAPADESSSEDTSFTINSHKPDTYVHNRSNTPLEFKALKSHAAEDNTDTEDYSFSDNLQVRETAFSYTENTYEKAYKVNSGRKATKDTTDNTDPLDNPDITDQTSDENIDGFDTDNGSIYFSPTNLNTSEPYLSGSKENAVEIIEGHSWGAGATITYSFLDHVPSYYRNNDPEREGFAEFTLEMQQATRAVIANLESFANINLVEVDGVGDVTFAFYEGNGFDGVGHFPGGSGRTAKKAGDVWIDQTPEGGELDPTAGGFGRFLLFHELGHAMGLLHTHDGSADVPGYEDNTYFSVMSYNLTTSPDPESYQLYDIYALQQIYGANTTSSSGNDIYNLREGSVYTIWDASGYDILDASSATSDIILRLGDGEFSSVGGSNNIAIAYDAAIEEARGGSGDDIIIGSDRDDVLAGGAGSDLLDGADGYDTAAYALNIESYCLYDVSALSLGHKIEIGINGDINSHISIEEFDFQNANLSHQELLDYINRWNAGHLDGPVANNETLYLETTGDQDTPPLPSIQFNVLDNDTNEVGMLRVIDYDKPLHGNLVINADGSATYTPTIGFTGTDSFTYTISDGKGGTDTATASIVVGPDEPNKAPDATDDTASMYQNDGSVIIHVLRNDSDPDGDTIQLGRVTNPDNGSVSVNYETGEVTYTADTDFVGTDTFTYAINDGNGGFDQATVTVHVLEQPDNPTQNTAPRALNDSVTTDEGTGVKFNILSNDYDPDGDAISISYVGNTQNGFLNVDEVTGTATYMPNAGFTGTDTFSYVIIDENGLEDDALVTIEVVPLESDPETPPDDNPPPEPINDAPTAEDDFLTISNNAVQFSGNTYFYVLENDVDSDGDNLFILDFTQALHGTVSLVDAESGRFKYATNASFEGVDSFTYTISDGNGGTDTATVNIQLEGLNNEAPVAVDDYVEAYPYMPIQFNILANDYDAEGSISLEDYTQGSHGSVTVSYNTGTALYTPNSGFVGTDTFTYTIMDENGAIDTATVTIRILGDGTEEPIDETPDKPPTEEPPVTEEPIDQTPDEPVTEEPPPPAPNDDPIALDDYIGLEADDYNVYGATYFYVTRNDSDPDGDDPFVNGFTKTEHGSLYLVNPDTGLFKYTPNDSFDDFDSFTYTIDDGNGGTDTATVTLENLIVENTAPVAQDDYAEAALYAPIQFNVLANDYDTEGHVSLESYTEASHGTLSVSYNTGTFLYVADEGFIGVDEFTYTITDSEGLTDTATVRLVVGVVSRDSYSADELYFNESSTDDSSAYFARNLDDGSNEKDALNVDDILFDVSKDGDVLEFLVQEMPDDITTVKDTVGVSDMTVTYQETPMNILDDLEASTTSVII